MTYGTRVAVVNFSGNVGKSTVAAHMLAPRIPGARLIFCESFNDDSRGEGVDGEQIRAREFKTLLDEVLASDSTVVDVGASNVEQFMAGLRLLQGSHDEFDMFVVPTAPTRKQQVDTVSTVQALRRLGVPRDKVRLVFNRVNVDADQEEVFAGLIELVVNAGLCHGNLAATVHDNEVFELLKGSGRSLASICADATDWRELARQSTNLAERRTLIANHTLRMMARTASSNLDEAFAALMPC